MLCLQDAGWPPGVLGSLLAEGCLLRQGGVWESFPGEGRDTLSDVWEFFKWGAIMAMLGVAAGSVCLPFALCTDGGWGVQERGPDSKSSQAVS